MSISDFLAGSPHAVVGASNDRSKFGNRVLRMYMQREMPVYPVNPNEATVEGLDAWPDLASLPEQPHGISIITPPPVTEKIVEQAAELGIHHVWMQPGAESELAITRARDAGMNVIAGGPCLLVELA